MSLLEGPSGLKKRMSLRDSGRLKTSFDRVRRAQTRTSSDSILSLCEVDEIVVDGSVGGSVNGDKDGEVDGDEVDKATSADGIIDWGGSFMSLPASRY